MPTPLASLVEVITSPTTGQKRLISLVSLPPDAILTPITGATRASDVAWNSIQASETAHLDLSSELVYTNHSCNPSVVFDMEGMEVRVADRDGKGLEVGDEVTFFYPSTEWEMAQPFECACGSERCLGVVKGAKCLEREEWKGRWRNGFIGRLIVERDGG